MSTSNSPGPSTVEKAVNDSAEIIEEESSLPTEPEITISPSKKTTNFSNVPAPYISDPLLIPRVIEFINHIQEQPAQPGEHYIDVEEIVDELQSKYQDYRKKKRIPFKASVQKALTVIMRNHGMRSDSGSSGASDEESDGMETLPRQCSDSNSQIVNMYLQNKKGSANKVMMDGDQELIDIGSSDDEGDNDDDPEAAIMQEASRQESLRAAAAMHAQARRSIAKEHQREAACGVDKDRAIPNILRKRKSPPEVETNSKQKASNPSKKRKFSTPSKGSEVSFKDVGGNESCLKEVCQLLVHIKHPEVYKQLGVSPPRGFLLHGPPGCGKSLLAQAIAGELKIPIMKVAATELVAGVSGESEERIRELFEQAMSTAPCVLFLDEIDAIAPHRSTAQREMERRIVAQLLSSMDDLAQNGSQVLVVGATNRPDALDPALRRAGRFDREVSLGIPDEKARTSILKVLCAKLKLAPLVDLVTLGKLTPGFVGADLASLTREAAMAAVNRVLEKLKHNWNETKSTIEEASSDKVVMNGESSASSTTNEPTSCKENGDVEMAEVTPESTTASGTLSLNELMEWLKEKPPLNEEQLSQLSIEQGDFEKALKCVQPSAKREGFATVPDVTWDDVGSLKDVREELKMTILAPVKFSEQFATLGLTTPAGVLLCGPPGCGKTLLAKAVANEAGINFISVKGPELLNMYVGESERAVRQCFQRAKNSAPCVIFFDELDSLCPKRSDSAEGGSSMRVVNQMLTEMDGIEGRKGVFLMAATNRPDIVDPAVLRPGRLDKTLYIGLPGVDDRSDILRALTKGGTCPSLGSDVSLEGLSSEENTGGYTGADLAALVREASLQALRGVMAEEPGASLIVRMKHFKQAISKIRPSVSDKDKKKYESLRLLYGPKTSDENKSS